MATLNQNHINEDGCENPHIKNNSQNWKLEI